MDVLREGIERVSSVVAEERVRLRRRAERAHATGLPQEELATLLALAKASELIGAFEEAIEAGQRAAALARELDDQAHEPRR